MRRIHWQLRHFPRKRPENVSKQCAFFTMIWWQRKYQQRYIISNVMWLENCLLLISIYIEQRNHMPLIRISDKEGDTCTDPREHLSMLKLVYYHFRNEPLCCHVILDIAINSQKGFSAAKIGMRWFWHTRYNGLLNSTLSRGHQKGPYTKIDKITKSKNIISLCHGQVTV